MKRVTIFLVMTHYNICIENGFYLGHPSLVPRPPFLQVVIMAKKIVLEHKLSMVEAGRWSRNATRKHRVLKRERERERERET